MWHESIVEGKTIWESDHGTVFKTPDGKYVCGVPRVIKLGPFEDLEQAKVAAEDSNGNLNRVLENYNLHLKNLISEIKE